MTYAALAIAFVALLAAVLLFLRVRALERRVDAVPADGGVFTAIRAFDNELGKVDFVVRDLVPRLERVERRLPQALSHTGVVAYDAFDNIAGNQSRSIALLNARGDGVVISLLVGRNETLFFTKQVLGTKGVEPLSPEEEAAVASAMGR